VTREHSPRPGATWDTRLVRVEQVVDTEHPADPHPNRAARRAAKRAKRKASR
jgi:hypothetical protein